MNHFELYGIPVSFSVDKTALKKRFFELSKLYHPDFHSGASTEKQAEVLELATQTTKGWQTLSNEELRTEYILQLHNLIEEGEKYTLSPLFLGEMMDINEALMDLEMNPDAKATVIVDQQVGEHEQMIAKDFKDLAQQFDKDPSQKAVLEKIKELHYRKKYLLRIRSTLNTFAAR